MTDSPAAPPFDARAFRDALGCFATGVCVASTRDAAGLPIGVTVNSFTSVSLDPPLVLFCLDRAADSLSAFLAADGFAISVLAADQRGVSANFAQRPTADRWAGLAAETLATGAPLIPGALAALDCRRHAVHDGGDHVILVGRVVALRSRADGRPLLYVRGAYGDLA